MQQPNLWDMAPCFLSGPERRLEAEVNGKQQAQEPVDRDHTLSIDDAAAEDSITMAKIVASEAKALEVVITDKNTGDQTMEAVHCLVCKQVVL
ncbi:hypothetical protein E4T44_06279 [Aureobasidium sp. EXF-8845]|nr:hypothetical protein E4T44_06279 [Aureobasidium sp. EXF-8845]KAI4845122.1 hypothetical protein E4T45_07851 [Aureobasidium sp. EXF-8846]